jgi:hypothetical protein
MEVRRALLYVIANWISGGQDWRSFAACRIVDSDVFLPAVGPVQQPGQAHLLDLPGERAMSRLGDGDGPEIWSVGRQDFQGTPAPGPQAWLDGPRRLAAAAPMAGAPHGCHARLCQTVL